MSSPSIRVSEALRLGLQGVELRPLLVVMLDILARNGHQEEITLLLNAMLDNPNKEAVGIYADWLDDHERNELADHVRGGNLICNRSPDDFSFGAFTSGRGMRTSLRYRISSGMVQ